MSGSSFPRSAGCRLSTCRPPHATARESEGADGILPFNPEGACDATSDDYPNRPIDPCVNFSCGWIMAASPLPDWMKPDNARVIVLFNKFQWQGVPVDLAVRRPKRMPPRPLTWLRKFAETHRRPLVHTEQILVGGEYQEQQQVFGDGPPAFQQELLRRQGAGLALWS